MKLQDLEKMLRKRCQLYRKRFIRSKSSEVRFPFTSNVNVTDMLGTIGNSTSGSDKYGFVHCNNQNLRDRKEFENQNKTERGNKFSYFDWKSEDNLPIDFCKHTSLHGLKYIGERKRHLIERIFWTVAFIVSLVAAYYMISDVWRKYRNNSVIITFAPYDTKIEEIPFPAITICNMNKVLKSKAMQFMQDSKGPSGMKETRAARENLYYLNHVCSSSKSFTRTFNYSANRGKIDSMSLHAANKNEDNYDGGKEDLWQFFLEASPLCRDMILKCVWQEEVKNCSELFRPIETDVGKCCTFNMVPPAVLHKINMTEKKDEPWEWDGDSFLRKDHKKKYPEFPRRQKVPGKSFGLSILLNPDLDEYFCTTSDSVGFRIATHLPINVPHIGDLGNAVMLNAELFINIRPTVTIADKDSIRDFSLEQRQCYFNEEQKLGYYNYYSSSNCIDECIANLTYRECNCRRHYQPGDDKKPLCGPKEFQCASSIKKKFVGNDKTYCKQCIPTCTEIAYHTETTYSTLQSPDILWTDGKGKKASWAHKNVSIVHIYFGEGSTNAKLRKELYGAVDLIANFGGLMGLCLGFSGLSLIEVIYFCTIRAWFNSTRNRLENTQNSKRDRETTNKLLNNEVSRIPVYRSPDSEPLYEKRDNNPKIYDTVNSHDRKKNKTGPNINHILYTVAYTHDPIPTDNSGGLNH